MNASTAVAVKNNFIVKNEEKEWWVEDVFDASSTKIITNGSAEYPADPDGIREFVENEFHDGSVQRVKKILLEDLEICKKNFAVFGNGETFENFVDEYHLRFECNCKDSSHLKWAMELME